MFKMRNSLISLVDNEDLLMILSVKVIKIVFELVNLVLKLLVLHHLLLKGILKISEFLVKLLDFLLL